VDAAIVVLDGVDEMDVVGPYEVLDIGAKGGAGLHVRLVALPRAATAVAGQRCIASASRSALDDRVAPVVELGGAGCYKRQSASAR